MDVCFVDLDQEIILQYNLYASTIIMNMHDAYINEQSKEMQRITHSKTFEMHS